MKKWALALLTLFSLIIMTRALPVQAATPTASLTIRKVVSVTNGNTVTQQTKPLAGARYRLVRIQKTSTAAIDPTNAATFRVLAGQWGFDTTVMTGANGEAQIAPLVIGADYLLTELPGAGVKTPAAPVHIRFSLAQPHYTYTPKSGLVPIIPPKTPTPAGERVGNGTKHTATILQTGGRFTLPLVWPCVLMVGLMMAVALVAWRVKAPASKQS